MNIRIPPGHTAFRTPGRTYLVKGGWLAHLQARLAVWMLEPIQPHIACLPDNPDDPTPDLRVASLYRPLFG